MDVSVSGNVIFVFGRFRLTPARRTLTCDGARVKLASRPFDALLYLVANAGRVVEKDELFEAVWGGRVVEDNNLNQTISMLRKVLHRDGVDPVIVTVAGRGYRFAAPVQRDEDTGVFPPAHTTAAPDTATAEVAPTARPRPPAIRLAIGAACAAIGGIVLWIAGASLLAPHRPTPEQPAAAPFAPPPHSVAVLAFDTIGTDPTQAYLANGLSEELIATLSQVNALRVAARTSSFSFRGTPTKIDEIGRKLNVAAVLEGTSRQSGNTMRVTTNLIDTRTGYAIWSHVYDRPAGDMLHLETDIATDVAAALKITLLDGDVTRMRIGGPHNPRALDAYLRGITLKHKMDPANAHAALAAFDQAIALDPDFAWAHVLRAKMLTGMAEGFGEASTDVAYLHSLAQQGLAEAELATRLAPDLAAAHAALGSAAEDFWDFRRASAEFTRAADLAPNDAPTLLDYAWMQAYTGHTENAVTAARRAADLNPLSATVYADVVWTQIWAGHPDEAADTLRHAEQLGISKSLAAYLNGRIALAHHNPAAAQRACAAADDWKRNYCLAIADHLLGQQPAAETELAALRSKMGDNAAYQYADIYAQWGRPTDAVAALQTAYRLHDTGLMEIEVDPLLDPIRASPDFQSILHRLDFPS